MLDRKFFHSFSAAEDTFRATKKVGPIDLSLQGFDELPSSAHVRLPVVLALFACSRATVWRHVKAGFIPAPVKFGTRITAWNVGVLRTHLKAMN